MILLDANVLVRLSDSKDPEYRRVQQAVFARRSLEVVAIAPQTLYEFWAVATRAKSVNGLDMSVSSAKQWIAACSRMFHLLQEPAELVEAWATLVEKYGVTGFRAHDARYVALMQLHGITHFMTYNVKHFSNYPINIVDPSAGKPSN